jgi:hypothetical protein
MICETTDFIYPILADIYYPIVDQSSYGNVKKQWILDRTIACYFESAGSAGKEEVKPNANITKDVILSGRSRTDIRVSKYLENNSMTNVLVTNIRDASGNHIYTETSGARSGKSTIFELATQDPTLGPFGTVEYYKLVIRRSENQAADV